jgi:hypothetical protein
VEQFVGHGAQCCGASVLGADCGAVGAVERRGGCPQFGPYGGGCGGGGVVEEFAERCCLRLDRAVSPLAALGFLVEEALVEVAQGGVGMVPGAWSRGAGGGLVGDVVGGEAFAQAIDGQVGGEVGAAEVDRLTQGVGVVGCGQAVAGDVSGLRAHPVLDLDAEGAEGAEGGEVFGLVAGSCCCGVRLVAQPFLGGDRGARA